MPVRGVQQRYDQRPVHRGARGSGHSALSSTRLPHIVPRKLLSCFEIEDFGIQIFKITLSNSLAQSLWVLILNLIFS